MAEVASNEEPQAQTIVGKDVPVLIPPKLLSSRRTESEDPEEKEAFNSLYSHRSFVQYLDILGISQSDLGKMVLDLGSGILESFSREAIVTPNRFCVYYRV